MTETAKRKLLIVITKSNFGGAQRYVYDLSRSLKDRYDVTVALGGEGQLVSLLEAQNIRIVRIKSLGRDVSVFKDVKSFFSLFNLIRKERPDLLHLNSSKIGGIGAVAALPFKTRVIFTAHAWAFNEDRGTLSKALITLAHWISVRLSDKTIAVSNAVKSQVVDLPDLKDKISVVHLGIEAFSPLSRADARAKLGIAPDSFAIGTVAELHPVKGLEYALDGVKALAFPYSYTIVGQGDLKAALESKIETDGLKGTVALAGLVPNAQTVISAFDVFLLPSLSEAFGYVLVESGMSNVPVIATSVGGIPEIIEDMKSGILIHPKNAKEIATSITFLHENPDKRAELAAALNARVKTYFSLERMVSETVAIYEAK